MTVRFPSNISPYFCHERRSILVRSVSQCFPRHISRESCRKHHKVKVLSVMTKHILSATLHMWRYSYAALPIHTILFPLFAIFQSAACAVGRQLRPSNTDLMVSVAEDAQQVTHQLSSSVLPLSPSRSAHRISRKNRRNISSCPFFIIIVIHRM